MVVAGGKILSNIAVISVYIFAALLFFQNKTVIKLYVYENTIDPWMIWMTSEY